MPGRQQPNSPVESTTPGQSTYLKLPSQSFDTASPHRLPRSPSLFVEPSNKLPGKRHKRVRWASSVVDNEHKMLSRPGTPPKVRTSTKNPPVPVPSGTKLSTSRPPTANTAIKIIPSSSRQPSNKTPAQGYRPETRPAQSSTPSQRQSPIPANGSSKLAVSSPTYNSPKMTIRAPPAVPDPPKSPGPPPAPRPRRLPTPDLPEIDESKFFIPKERIPGYQRNNRHSKDRPTHLFYEDKTDVQMAAAKAYMQERKREN